MIKVAISHSIFGDVQRGLADDIAQLVELVGVDPNASDADLTEVAAAIRWDLSDQGFRSVLDQASSLKWLHSPGAGVEGWPLDELAARNIVLTNAAGVFAIPIAEWVLATMLSVAKQLHTIREAQHQHRWAADVTPGELYGKTLLILGTGGIASQVISRASSFGMRVWAANRSGRPVPQAERTVQGDAWRDLLPETDFIVSTLPLTEQTHGIIGAADLEAIKPGAWVINVGRGATIDEDALLNAAQNGPLGGAALDVWTTEPLPADSPFWTTPNIIVSPHLSGESPAGRSRGLSLFTQNLSRFAAGQPLTNVVDLKAGY